MPKEILLTALSADFEGGALEEWHKQVGDPIEAGDIIVDVSTDKAVIELLSAFTRGCVKTRVPLTNRENRPAASLQCQSVAMLATLNCR